MSGNRLCHIGILQSMLSDHIRRIACYRMKRSCSKNFSSLFNITADNINVLFQTVISYASLRQLRTFFLYLQTGKMSSRCLCFQKNRNNPCAGSHIQNMFIIFYFCKTREQNRIHSKTEFLRILNHIISILEIIYAFPRPYQTVPLIIFHEIWNLLLYLPAVPALSFPFQKSLLFSFWDGISALLPDTPEFLFHH